MNKDFQKVLILGVISIVISALALYSFKDVKFKNTKKMAEQAKQEHEIIQEYENLLSDPSDIFTINYDENFEKTGEIILMMPEFLFNSGFQKIESKLKEQEIQVNFALEQDISLYKEKIKNIANDANIYLLPSTWLKGLDLETINIGDNPKVYFHQIFNEIVSVSNNLIIPYSIDPLITIKKESINIDPNWNNLYYFVSTWTKGRTNSIPIIWGIGKNDIRLLERGEEAFENYFEILYLHLKQIRQDKNLNELKNMLNLEKLSLEYQYDYLRFRELYNTISNKDVNCKLFPSICLMSYNFGDIKFGYLSDFDILDKYFQKNENLFEIDNFSNTKTSYPVRGWVFVVPKGNEKILLANEFFKEYLKEGVSGNTGLWNNTLSAINDIYNMQIENNKYSKILENKSNFELIYESANLQDEFLKDNKHLDVLKGNYNPDLYISR